MEAHGAPSWAVRCITIMGKVMIDPDVIILRIRHDPEGSS